MMRGMTEEQYEGYLLAVETGIPSDFPGPFARAVVREPTEGRLVSQFVKLIDGALIGGRTGLPDNEEGAKQWLSSRAYHRARGAILLGQVAEVNRARYIFSPDSRFANRTDESLRREILGAFQRAYQREPMERGRVVFDDIGVALIENVDPTRVEYVLERLDGDGLIKSFAQGHERGARLYMPTPEGMTVADRLADDTKAPGALVEETVAEVERVLGRHAPELADRLRSLALQVTKAPELSHADASDIAHNCYQIIQDFLDLDVLWEGVSTSRPARKQTRDRLSIILNARSGSETEQALLPEFVTLFDWLRDWDKFVHKYRHPDAPAYSERRHAKRLVLHTYLLLSDISELLSL